MAQFGGMTATISYNGYVFDERTETIGISARPKYDAAGRTVSFVVHTITLRTIITTPNQTLDQGMAAIRRLLLAPGKAFRYVAAGYGAMAINVTDVAKDVVWGPKPQELSYKPIGVRAAEIVWRVEVAIPECSNAVTSRAIMEFNYTLAIEIDRAGFTSRTYQGYYVIAMTRQLNGTRQLNDSADAYWEDVLPVVPSGFRRNVQQRTLDETKARMTFTVTDEEMGPNILPPGIVDCKASHSLETSATGMTQWVGVIRADYEIARDYSPAKTYEHFIKLVRQRLAETNRLRERIETPTSSHNIMSTATKGYLVPLGFAMEEPDIYGRPMARYSMRYMLTQPFRAILKASSLWLPVDNDWKTWKASLANSALAPRGNAGMKFRPQDDAVIDLCVGATEVALKTQEDVPNAIRTLIGEDLDQACPSANDSWLAYELSFEAESEDRVMVHKVLPVGDSTASVSGSVASGYSQVVDAPPDIVQRTASNADVIYVVGRAVRACYDIVQPRLRYFGDREAVLANRPGIEYFKTEVSGKFGHTVITARWRQRYILKAKQRQVSLSSVGVRAMGTPVAPREAKQTAWTTQEVRLRTETSIDD